MPPDSIPQISLGTAALVIFAICAGFILLRGVTRMLVGVLVLCGSAWAGFRVWQVAPSLAIDWTGKPVAWISTGLPVIAFIASFLILRGITRFIARPFGKSDEERPKRSAGQRLALIAFALIPAAAIWLTGATFVHHAGSIAEIKSSTGESSDPSLIQQLKDSVATIIPAAWLQKLDPLADPQHLSLAKLIASRNEPEPVIDPETGKPYPRAIIVDDPALQELASEGRMSTLLRHPLFQKALEDPQVQALLKNSQR